MVYFIFISECSGVYLNYISVVADNRNNICIVPLLNYLCISCSNYCNFFENNLHLASLFDSYYDEDQEKLFNEAHVISPFRKMSEVVRQPQVQVTVGIILMW